MIKLENIISANYFVDPLVDDTTPVGIRCVMTNKSQLGIPLSDKNEDYNELMRLVDEGLLTIADAD